MKRTLIAIALALASCSYAAAQCPNCPTARVQVRSYQAAPPAPARGVCNCPQGCPCPQGGKCINPKGCPAQAAPAVRVYAVPVYRAPAVATYSRTTTVKTSRSVGYGDGKVGLGRVGRQERRAMRRANRQANRAMRQASRGVC